MEQQGVSISRQEYQEFISKLVDISADLKGVNRRLDIANGRTAKNEDRIINLEKADILVSEHIKNVQIALAKEQTGEEKARDRRQRTTEYWIQTIGTKVLWFVMFVMGIVLTKLGIINIKF